MPPINLTPTDRQQLHGRGITEETILDQLSTFKQGIPYTTLHRPCTVGDGIITLPPNDLDRLTRVYAEAAASGRAAKFVPASGAASRMFRPLLIGLEGGERLDEPYLTAKAAQHDNTCRELLLFIHGLPHFAFYGELQEVMRDNSIDPQQLLAQGPYNALLDYLLTSQGLNYANLPKALLTFHRYSDHCRTPLEEHLVEAAAYIQDDHAQTRLHFTLTPAHYVAVVAHLEAIRQRYERAGVRFAVTFSSQQPATDTIAVNLDNQPFRDRHGHLVFRPAGHGALLHNLQALAGDIVFIKNIDNVVPDHLKAATYLYKRALGGVLVDVQKEIFTFMSRLQRQDIEDSELNEMLAFANDRLSHIPPPGLVAGSRQTKAAYLNAIFNRPLRVCGMVQNAAEPGGGPFWVQHSDGSQAVQIVESSQVDLDDAGQRTIMTAATHFNPVDLVCGVRDFQGRPFDLAQFTDPKTGFISRKSYEGEEIKGLELPGLWNGAMAQWNTVFVETPLSTFNPVKNVLDLLRPQHQPDLKTPSA
ncbi:MAG: DUF4301 family protein [bacterium]|nr:DUF4301 family protein [bacterium]